LWNREFQGADGDDEAIARRANAQCSKLDTNGKGSIIFLLTDGSKLTTGNPFDIEWVSAKGEFVRLTG
jgi:hypothetical protein